MLTRAPVTSSVVEFEVVEVPWWIEVSLCLIGLAVLVSIVLLIRRNHRRSTSLPSPLTPPDRTP